jgi:hypothetical protein
MPTNVFGPHTSDDLTQRCDRCNERPTFGCLHRCGQCSFWFCEGCRLEHILAAQTKRNAGEQAFCDKVIDTALLNTWHRLSEEFFVLGFHLPPPEHLWDLRTAEDFDFARKSWAHALFRGEDGASC